MPFLLRGPSDRRGWDPRPWVPEGDIPAGPFYDFRPSPTSQLSVWVVQDDQSNLNRIVAALAAGRDHVDKFDYVLVDEREAADLRVRMELREERCADQAASALWHRNMLELTATQLNGLVRCVFAARRTGRVQEPDVEALIRGGVVAGQIDRARVHPKLLESLGL